MQACAIAFWIRRRVERVGLEVISSPTRQNRNAQRVRRLPLLPPRRYAWAKSLLKFLKFCSLSPALLHQPYTRCLNRGFSWRVDFDLHPGQGQVGVFVSRGGLHGAPRRFRPAHDRVNAGAHSSLSLHYFLIPLSGPIWLDPNNSTQRVSWTVSLRLEMPFSPMRPSMPVCLA